MRKSIRVALLGNMNNNFFNLARYLRDLGYDAHLYIFPYEPAHFYPEADSYESTYNEYVHFLDWGNAYDLLNTSREKVKEDVGTSDFFIGCGTAPAYLAKAGIKTDIFIPYGSDLYDLPFYKIVRFSKLWHYYIFTKFQKKGIGDAKNVNISDTAALFNKCLSKLGFSGNRLFTGIPMVYTQQYSPERINEFYPVSKYFDSFNKIRKQFDVIIFHNSRHCWNYEPDPVALKDNDKLFKALALFKQKRPKEKIAIVTFEYGRDVPSSKELVQQLNIEESVFWFPLMPRKEIMIGMSLADIVAGEFRNSWFTYGVVFESMALGKPVMHFRNDSLYPDMELYPMIYAKTTDDICSALLTYSKDKQQLVNIGQMARQWFLKNIVEKSLSDIRKILNHSKETDI